MKRFKQYRDMVTEEELNDQLYEMANIHPRTHGVKDTVIWVGAANKRHGLRVKVSNVKNKFDRNNNFIIQMPSLDYDPTQVAKWIDIEAIKTWIKLNQKLLYDYEEGKIDDTGEFLEKISKI